MEFSLPLFKAGPIDKKEGKFKTLLRNYAKKNYSSQFCEYHSTPPVTSDMGTSYTPTIMCIGEIDHIFG